jgi:hypothetical protein
VRKNLKKGKRKKKKEKIKENKFNFPYSKKSFF